MSNELQVFQYEGNRTRVVVEDGELWICARDVAEALGYSEASMSNMGQLLNMVPDGWKGRKRITTPGGGQEMLCLSEQGLYFFLGRSDKPAALPYQMWIAGEVVPLIRERGIYIAPQMDHSVARDKDALAWEKIALEKRKEVRLRAKGLLDGLKEFKDVMTPESKTVIMVKYNEMLAECDMSHFLPIADEKWYSATDLGEEFGVFKQKIGSIANEHGLKAPEGQSNEYGTWIRSKSPNSPKEVMTWVYYEPAREWFRDYFDNIKRSCSTLGKVTQLPARCGS